jgi:hypothetical protein
MLGRKFLAAAIAALALVAFSAAPASAAGGGDPKVKSKGEYSVYENGYTTLDFQYRCATGHTASIYAEIWQGGTRENPVSIHTSDSTDFHPPTLICDGDKHTGGLGLILVGYTELNPYSPYEYLGDTDDGYGRGNVKIVLTDITAGTSDTDYDTIDVISRDF